ncbi:kikA from plasmid origin [Pantoea sp. BAV 3049]|uniref:kikA from plasmid origin n=1 Tax=Pantoea sp. BAV 3049 TaxID=2654188 RepID=UPI00131DDFF2|nr:kikA from plasmid origin [Pantoea sp. BAV 3049]
MNNIVTATAFLCLTAGFIAPSFASDPCEVVLCMAGKAMGSGGGSDCKSAERDFFNIVKKNKNGFLPSHTSDARKALLVQCKEADPSTIAQIISKFGTVRL